jgi:hypothetical protein
MKWCNVKQLLNVNVTNYLNVRNKVKINCIISASLSKHMHMPNERMLTADLFCRVKAQHVPLVSVIGCATAQAAG